MKIDINNESEEFELLYKNNNLESKITKIVEYVLQKELDKKILDKIELSILNCDDEKIRQLNKEYRDKDKATNVLSFPSGFDFEEDENYIDILPLGDIIIAYEYSAQEAIDENKNFMDHYFHLTIHGLLHLLGYDHEDEEDAEIMEALEAKYLEHFGVKNPYQ